MVARIDFVVRRGEVELHGEALGESSAPGLLLLAGNGCSSTYWPDAFCAPLVAAGLYVVRFDYRDTGRSTRRPFAEHPYDLSELEADATAILDHCGIEAAHLVGLSMGGFLAQRIALDFPARVRSLVSMMSTSDYLTMLHTFGGGDAPTSGLPPPSRAWLEALGRLPPNLSPRELLLESWRLAVGAAAFDRDDWAALVDTARARGDDFAAGESHRAACARSDRLNLLGELRSLAVPALFIEGAEDPIFPRGHAEASAAAAPKGRVVCLDGLGHGLAPAFIPRIAAEVLEHVRSDSERRSARAISRRIIGS